VKEVGAQNFEPLRGVLTPVITGIRRHGSGDATFHYVVAFWYNVERHGGILELVLAPACLAGRGFFATVGKSI
jgi:hypothetical protein